VLERIGAWLRVWTPPRDAEVPRPPWRRIAIGAVLALIVLGGAAAVLVPEIEEGKDERAEAERRRDAAYEAAKDRRLEREGKVRSGQGMRPSGNLSPAAERRARRALVHDLEESITRDARARVRRGNLNGPILRTECEINPPSQRPRERDLSVRSMEYDCVAVRTQDPGGSFVVGHSFDAVVDYRRFRYSWAKVCLVPGEGAARPEC
jgi:hypothetical protein